MTCFSIPDGIIEDINSMISAFWWGMKDNKWKISWVAWKKMSASKRDGEMGFRDLRCFNLALLAKQGWRILTQPSSLLARVLKAKYFPYSSFFDATLGQKPSWSWRSILDGREVLNLGCRKFISSDTDTRIVTDRWLPRPSSFSVFGTIAPCSPLETVDTLIDPITRSWDS